MKMKPPGTSRFLLKIFLLLILTTNLVTSAEAKLLPMEKAEIVSQRSTGQLQDTNTPTLSEFTVCIDLYCKNNAPWTAFSYCVKNGPQPAELGLGFFNENTFQIFHLGVHYEFEQELELYTWYTVCLTWKESTRQLEAYVNGTRVYNTTTSDDSLEGRGSLVLGSNHSRDEGSISPVSGSEIYGDLYNFQMWNYSRSPNELYDCSEGNLLSWTKELWNFQRPKPDKTLRCAKVTDKPPSTETTTTSQTTTTTTTTLSPSTSTPLDLKLSSTETLNAATRSTSKITPTPVLYPTTVTEMGTTSVSAKSPGSQTTDEPGLSGNSTQSSTTESIPGNNVIVNSSIILPTRNNVSTTGNISSSHPIHPVATTTSPWVNHTTDQEVTTYSTLRTSSPYVTINPGSLAVTTADLSKGSSTTNLPPPLFTVSYFVVSMTLKFTAVVTDEDAAASLVKSTMDSFLNNTGFSVLEITVSKGPSNEPGNVPTQKSNKKKREAIMDSVVPNKISKLIIQANSSATPESLAEKLHKLLEKQDFKDEQGNISFSAQSVNIKTLDLEKCPAENKHYDQFIYKWMETNPTETAEIRCYTNPDEFATRYCSLSVTTDSAKWEKPDFSRCDLAPLPNSFEGLDNITVTPENAKYLAEHILNMTKHTSSLQENDIRSILSKVSEIITLGDIDVENAKINLNVINDILIKANGSLYNFTNQILNITEENGFKMNFHGESVNMTSDSMAVLVSKVNFSTFEDFSFTVKSYTEGKDLEMSLENRLTDNVVTSIYLPEEIQDQAGLATSKVQFNFLGRLSLFRDKEFPNFELNSYVISATVEGANIQKLGQPVRIKLQHINHDEVPLQAKCVFWDITKHGNKGGWNDSGCSTEKNDSYTLCNCFHLTHFGVLLDFSRTKINPWDEYIMTLVTYVGSGITSLFLGFTLVTYGMFQQLRRDYPSKILMNLSFSLLMLNLLFLVNDWLSTLKIHGLCISFAALLHYFLLTSFTWMGLEAVHMYFAFVKVFNSYIRKYILKLCIVGWGIPIVIVVAVLSINVDFYGPVYKNKDSDPEDDSTFCWIQNDVIFYVAVVAYFCIVFLIDIAMFIVVLLQIKSLKATKLKDWKALFLHDIKNTLSLACLLGLTWGFAFFAWGPVRITFLYLFAIFNTLQGFFIFVFHCLIKENVRRHWRMYLCCGRCQLDNYSDWSRLSNADTKHNGRIHQSPSDSYQSTRSNNTTSTNSSSLSAFSRDGYSVWTYGNAGGMFVNPAQAAPSNRATIYPDSWRTSPYVDFGTK